MHIISNYIVLLYVNAYKMIRLSEFVKNKRKQLGFTQEEFAEKAGVALTVIRKIEQGKENLSLIKVNQVLSLFGHVLVPTNEKDATRIS
jgi:y4mF family transcriptional regulator